MVVTLAQVEGALKEKLGAEKVEVFDTSGGCGASFEVSLVISEQFQGKRALERHRLVRPLHDKCEIFPSSQWAMRSI